MKHLAAVCLVILSSCLAPPPQEEIIVVPSLLCSGFSEFRNQKFASSLVLYTPLERVGSGNDGSFFMRNQSFCMNQLIAKDSIVSILRAQKNLLKSNDARLHLKVNEYLLKVPFDTLETERLDSFLLSLNSETEYERIYHSSNYMLDLETGKLEKVLHHF